MDQFDPLDQYAWDLGRLFGNFHSLEFALRSFLYSQADEPHSPFPPGVSPYAGNVGDEVPVNAFTSYDSLAELIERYNRAVGHRAELIIDPSLVDLRDALAHGRVSAFSPEPPLKLLKYSRPSKDTPNRVWLTVALTLTPEWFTTQRQRTHQAIIATTLAVRHFTRGAA